MGGGKSDRPATAKDIKDIKEDKEMPDEEEAREAGTPFLSFNPGVTPERVLGQLTAPADDVQARLSDVDPALPYRWTVWEQRVPSKDKKNAAYSDGMRESVTFGTAKEFWGIWNHLPQPSMLLSGQKIVRNSKEDGSQVLVDALMLFRRGVRPEWEDPANAEGGHFMLQLKPSLGAGAIDELWNNIVLGVVGGLIEPKDAITGVRLVDRLAGKQPCLRIEVWFDDMDLNDTGRLFKLKGNLEHFMRTNLSGEQRKATWGYTQKVSHAKAGS